MHKSELKLLLFEIFLLVGFLVNIFVVNIFNKYLIASIFVLFTLILIKLFGFERDKNIYKNNIVFFVLFYTFIFLGFMYGSGLLIGYVKQPYNYNIIQIIKNIIPYVLIIVSSEILRYTICVKAQKNRLLYITTILLFLLIDVMLNIPYYNFNNGQDIIELMTIILLPSLFMNIILTTFAYKYGYKQNIVYRLMLELYVFFIPITPDLGMYVEAVLLIVYPIILRKLILYRFEPEKKIDYKTNNKYSKIIVGSISLLLFIIVSLNSNLFRYWAAVIGSGSMEPTINIGDVIVVDKYYKKHLNKLKIGDVLTFKVNDKIYTHRIIKIEKDDGKYSISTKGDRKGQSVDSWLVSNDEVVGVVKLKVRYIGYPTVWLSRIMEG